MKNYIFTEKYRPRVYEDVVGLPNDLHTMLNDLQPKTCILLTGTPGTGKCLGKNTPIIMFNGETKNVQDIKKNDLLMGPDNLPRKVLSTTKGKGQLYKVHQNNGDNYIINDAHILSLVSSHKNIIQNINVEDYLKLSNYKQIDLKGYKVPIEFSKKNINIHPYYLGLWLGDGSSSNQRITNTDKEVITFLSEYATSLNYVLKNNVGDKTKCPSWSITHGNIGNQSNILLNKLKSYNLLNNKHIPNEFLLNTNVIKLDLLAGLIDSDGSVTSNCYEITQKNENLAKNIVFLGRSLGFKVSLKEKYALVKGEQKKYFRIFLSGDVWKIPCKIKRKQLFKHKRQKNHLRCGIKISKLGIDDYYGFELDGDKLFLLGDFTVTHNTTTSKILVAKHKNNSITLNASDERGIDVVRSRIKNFALNMSVDGGIKIINLEEFDEMCLTEDAEVIVGTLQTPRKLKLKDWVRLNKPNEDIIGRRINIPSLNTKTKQLENDEGVLLDTGYANFYEIELENGEKIVASENHPFFNKNLQEVKVKNLKEGDSIIDCSDLIFNKCIVCGKKTLNDKFCSYDCDSQYRSVLFLGKGNPNYGKSHSEDTRKIMSEKKMDLLVGEKNGNHKSNGGTWNGPNIHEIRTPEEKEEWKRRISKANKGRKYDDYRRSLCSIYEPEGFKDSNYRRHLPKTSKVSCELCNEEKNNYGADGIYVHHINHNHSDNRKENLMFVCPYCHNMVLHDVKEKFLETGWKLNSKRTDLK